jgi:hypothetical protein
MNQKSSGKRFAASSGDICGLLQICFVFGGGSNLVMASFIPVSIQKVAWRNGASGINLSIRVICKGK